MLKSSVWIKEVCEKEKMITPFVGRSVRDGVISYGLGPFGYDIRLDTKIKRISGTDTVVDPHNLSDSDYEKATHETIILEPGASILGKSIEYFKIPERIAGLAFGKSTYARCGILVNVTPLEPGWEGYLTISISNVSQNSVKLYSGEGIAQILFFEGDSAPLFSYSDLKGKYNRQDEITVAKI